MNGRVGGNEPIARGGFIPRREVLPEKTEGTKFFRSGCFGLLVVLLACACGVYWISGFLLEKGDVARHGSSAVAFFDRMHPFLKEWLPNWSAGVLFLFFVLGGVILLRRMNSETKERK